MGKAMGPFRDSHNPSWLTGLRTDVSSEPLPPLIGLDGNTFVMRVM